MTERPERSEEWLFRFRWLMLLPLLPLALLAAAGAGDFERWLGELENGWQALCLLVAFAGLGIRALTIGFMPDLGGAGENRDGRQLPRTGPYAIVRYPLYLGTYVSLLGLSLIPGSAWFVLATTLVFAVWYGRLIARNELALKRQFGEAYSAWAKRVPILLPNPFLWKPPQARFSLQRVLRHESNEFYLVVAGFTFVELSVDLLGERMSFSDWLVDDAHWALFFLVGTLIYLALRALAAPSFATETSAATPITRGILVSRRPRSVDVLENLISAGNLDAIHIATLSAANLTPGDRLVDVGCGSGRLAIAASALYSGRRRLEAIVGIDATPGMIDLAKLRARQANSIAEFKIGTAESLPLEDGSADAVTSSYLFHHLPSDVKRDALCEMWRVLAPGGRLVVTDYATPKGLFGQLAALPMRVNFYEYVRGQIGGELERMFDAEGLGPVEVVNVFLGYIRVFRIVKPGARRDGSGEVK